MSAADGCQATAVVLLADENASAGAAEQHATCYRRRAQPMQAGAARGTQLEISSCARGGTGHVSSPLDSRQQPDGISFPDPEGYGSRPIGNERQGCAGRVMMSADVGGGGRSLGWDRCEDRRAEARWCRPLFSFLEADKDI
jgi:hypothetical protein